ncbi:MAG: prolyl oligopeptidase family serine peptidase [Propionibacteriaceae bacterium]|jgi:prolyl oligopeptidase|nr:prolyl oligopeptidase family serine peptidase [Propionibacteriaceae bacterium]
MNNDGGIYPKALSKQATLVAAQTGLPSCSSQQLLNVKKCVPKTPLDPRKPDPYAWLEEVDDPRALEWAAIRTAKTDELLGDQGELIAELAQVLDSDERIPVVELIAGAYYNFWTDRAHPRGLWRRTTPESYATATPQWEPLLDLDALSVAENVGYVWHGAAIQREPVDGVAYSRALIALSPDGNDADITREFDMLTLRFVPATAGGFERAQSKGGLAWAGSDAVFVYTDFGADSMTPSGYPRIVKYWPRGVALAEAVVVFEGEVSDMAVGAFRLTDSGFERDVVERRIGFYSSQTYLVDAVGTAQQSLTRIDVPDTAEVEFHKAWVTVRLRDDWTTAKYSYRAGSLLVIPVDALLAGTGSFQVLFEPTQTVSLDAYVWTAQHLVLNLLDDVKSRVQVIAVPNNGSDRWGGEMLLESKLPVGNQIEHSGGFTVHAGNLAAITQAAPNCATHQQHSSNQCSAIYLDIGDPYVSVQIAAVDTFDSDDIWVTTTGFLTPPTLTRISVTGGSPTVRKTAPELFDSTGLTVEQRFVNSVDGTRVPYWLVGCPDQLSGSAGVQPTLLWGYGGFEIAVLSAYNPVVGAAWLARGGVYAAACIRGGGEYGSVWHHSALREKRHHAYEDFSAIARDLVASGITTSAHLGAQGRSNGGLLMGMMYTKYPELFAAVVCGVPLLDMLRYSHLLAGASWMAEFGDPDLATDWEFIRTFSPYHLFDAARDDYPSILIWTSTKDDRVHPGHARKMTALLEDSGKDVNYFETTEGGHAGSATGLQTAQAFAKQFGFLWQRLAG